MQIKNRLFSYPVFTSEFDDYKNNQLSFDYDVEVNQDVILIHYKLSLTNIKILSKIKEKTLKPVLLMTCAKTMYRKCFNLDSSGKIEIQSSDVSGVVEVLCLLIANTDFIVDKTLGINNDYEDCRFEIKKGYIVGYDNAYSFVVDKDKDENFKTSSILSVVKKIDLKDTMDVYLDDENKIKIQLGDEMYQQFVQIQGQNQLPIIHSMIVLPALVYVVEQIKNVSTRETYEEYYWYRCIAKQLEYLKVPIDGAEFEKKSSLVIAQELLKLPLKKALYNLTVEGSE